MPKSPWATLASMSHRPPPSSRSEDMSAAPSAQPSPDARLATDDRRHRVRAVGGRRRWRVTGVMNATGGRLRLFSVPGWLDWAGSE